MGMGTRLVVWLVLLGLVVPGLLASAPARPAAARSIEPSAGGTQGSAATARTAPDQPRLLVHFRPEATAAERAAAIASIGGTVDRELHQIDVTRVAIRIPADPLGDEPGLTALRLSQDPAVRSVEPDSIGSVQFAPNDPFYLSDPSFGLGQWGIRKAHVDQAWDIVRGSPSIIVAVIDTGIDRNHPDLGGVVLSGATFLTAPDPTCPAGSTIDDNGHGTHVAGVIAANGNNGIGIAGVAFGVKILPIKALDCQGAGLMSDVASGVIWATDHGARVINISLGSSAAQSTLQDAVRYAIARNVIVVAAAGNCGVLSSRCTTLNEPQYPGAYPEVLAVAATDDNDGHASFSNVGAYVGVSAPGVHIYGTIPTYPTTLSQSTGLTSYASISGTSQASPFVAAVAALLLGQEPGLSVAQLIDRLKSTADDLGAFGPDPVFGSGRVNALRAVTASTTIRYGASYDVSAVPARGTIGVPLVAAVRITNTSSFPWIATGVNPVDLAYHWADLANNTVTWDGQRSPLPADVPIGGTVTVNATILTPKATGTYVLRLDLVREGVAWFSSNGVATANVSVAITSGLAASYAPVASAQSTFVLGPTTFSVTVSNTGTAVWPAGGATPVRLSYHWLGPTGLVVVWDGARGLLPADVAPGQSAVVAMPIASPMSVGPYTLRLDLVQEGVTWFSAQGVTPRDIAVTVTTGVGATYAFASPATAFLPGSRVLVPVTLTNTGLLTWAAGGPNPVHAAAHLYDSVGRVVVWDGERAVLPRDVAPGQSIIVPVALAVPLGSSPASYGVRVDLVREGLAWFSDDGVAPGTGALRADPDYRASVATTATTVSRGAPSIAITLTNTSAVPWITGGSAPIDVSSHWLAADGTPLVWDGPRVALGAQTVAPGASISLTIPLAPPPASAVAVVVDLVAEGLRWFGNGSPMRVTLVP